VWTLRVYAAYAEEPAADHSAPSLADLALALEAVHSAEEGAPLSLLSLTRLQPRLKCPHSHTRAVTESFTRHRAQLAKSVSMSP
jgi:hypothetical protein